MARYDAPILLHLLASARPANVEARGSSHDGCQVRLSIVQIKTSPGFFLIAGMYHAAQSFPVASEIVKSLREPGSILFTSGPFMQDAIVHGERQSCDPIVSDYNALLSSCSDRYSVIRMRSCKLGLDNDQETTVSLQHTFRRTRVSNMIYCY